MQRQHWRVMQDRSVSDGPLSIGGVEYARGLGVHAESTLTFKLAGNYSTFHVVPGPDDAHGKLEMRILLDGGKPTIPVRFSQNLWRRRGAGAGGRRRAVLSLRVETTTTARAAIMPTGRMPICSARDLETPARVGAEAWPSGLSRRSPPRAGSQYQTGLPHECHAVCQLASKRLPFFDRV